MNAYTISVGLCLTEELGWRGRYSDWLRAGRPRGLSSSPGRVKNFHFSKSSGSGVHPTSYLIGTRGSFPGGVKRPGHEADPSPPTSAEVKKMWIYTFTPPYAFMEWCLITEAQGQLYLYLMPYREDDGRITLRLNLGK
jgi:hypothetical protein